MSELPPSLLECLRLRQAVLVAGSRCAELAELPTWDGMAVRLLARIADRSRREVIAAMIEARRTLAALGAMRVEIADGAIVEELRAALPEGRPIPVALAEAARVPWRGVITTAVDDLWPRALAAGDAPATLVEPGEELALGRLRGRFLLPLLGRLSAPASLCLGARDLAAKVVATPTAALIADAHRRWSFVFVGFAAGDPDRTLIDRLLGATGSTREHYFLCSGASAEEAEALASELALTAIPLEGGVGEALATLARGWSQVEAAARPAEEDVESWMERAALDPSDREARAALERGTTRLRADKDWERLVAVLIQRAEIEEDEAEQRAALREAGRLLDAELGSPGRAYRALVTALRLAPDDLSLVAELQRLARAAGIWDEFVREYGGLVEAIADPDDTLRHVLEMGRIFAGETGREDEAIGSFERVLAHDAGSLEALTQLERLYRVADRWADLARVLRLREDRAEDPAERRRLRTERIHLLLGPLDDPAAAIEALETLVGEDPRDRAALLSLEALYREHRRETDRLATLARLLPVAESDEERVALLRRLAAAHRARRASGGPATTDSEDAAIDALEKAYRLGDRLPDTLDWLAHAYERRETWTACADVLDRWAEITVDRTTRAELRERAGRIYRDKLADAATAEERYLEALELDPESPAVLLAIATLSRDRGDYFRAARFLLECAERTRSPLERARLLHDAGVLYQDHLDDDARATEIYAQALAADPEQVAAAERLAPLYEKTQAFVALEQVLDLLAHKTSRSDLEAADLHRRLGDCARRLGKLDKAQKSYEAARALAPQVPAVLRGLADIYLERKAWAEARALYETLRRQGEETLTVPDRIDLYSRLGHCAAQLEDGEVALRWLQAAVALDPPTEHKLTLLEEIAEVCLGQLDRPDEAVRALLEVLALAPNRRPAVHKLLQIHTEQKQWPEAVAALARLAAIETGGPLRAKYHYAAAVIQRDELGADDAAVQLFHTALDEDAEMHKAWEALERLLTEKQDWKGLARAYRRMIKRLPQEGMAEVRARLWNGLGVVSLRYLGDRQAAVAALEMASALDRDNLARHELLADLYIEMGPSGAEKAVAEHQFLVSRRPDRIESYQSLAALYQQMQAYDKLWCVAGALTYLNAADHYLRTFWERHRLSDVPVAATKLGAELWSKVVHPSEDRFISALFSLLAPALALTTAQRHQAMGVKRGDRIDLDRDDWFPAKALRYVSTTLEMPLPDLFVREKDPQTVSIYNLRDRGGLTPALVLGHGFKQWSTPWEVVFDLAKRMAFLRWERFPRVALMTPAALDIAVRAAMALGGRPLNGVAHEPHFDDDVERTRSKLFELVPEPLAHQLAVLAKEFRGDVLDISGWMAGADLSAARAAFVLSSDLPAAFRVLGSEPSGLSPLSLADRIGDLLAYSVSDEFFTVRQALGLTVV
jgi:tetratricopeptide (TPR) repeat protein